jgi:hypothetical protein
MTISTLIQPFLFRRKQDDVGLAAVYFYPPEGNTTAPLWLALLPTVVSAMTLVTLPVPVPRKGTPIKQI